MTKNVIKCGVLSAMAMAAILCTGFAISAGSGADDTGSTGKDAPAYVTYVQHGRYIIRTYNGKIALFIDDFDAYPAVETDIEVRLLRAYDRRLLDAGIEVSTYEDVLRLLEDFGS